MFKISFATGSRADYGIVRNYLKFLENDDSIDLSILVTGALLSREYGHQVDLIYNDGFKIGAELEIPVDSSSNTAILHAMAIALEKFGNYFAENVPNLLIILGDRYEMLSVATAAAMNRIPILHIHGGEATFGNYDEFIRHAISKMSLFHFTATEEYKNRVIQLGEDPRRVFNLGALGAENCLHIDMSMVPNIVKNLAKKSYCVVLFHPETLTNVSVTSQVEELLEALNLCDEYMYVFIGSNADTNSDVIRRKVNEYVNSHNNTMYFENLTTSGYHYLIKNAMGLIGNSSSGIIEAPSLGTYTINIGDRQSGRVRGNSVLDVKCNKDEIVNAIMSLTNGSINEKINNPYYRENTAVNYYTTTLELIKRLENNNCISKRFYDLG